MSATQLTATPDDPRRADRHRRRRSRRGRRARRRRSIDQVLQSPAVARPRGRYGRALVLRKRGRCWRRPGRRPAGARRGSRRPPGRLAARLAARLECRPAPSLRARDQRHRRRVHTNLGRAPLPRRPRAGWRRSRRATRTSSSTSAAGERGEREVHAEARLRALLGAEAAVVVNNNAAAVLLAVNTLRRGPRGAGQPRRAGGDRRLLPHPRRAAQERRPPARGRAPPTARGSRTTAGALGPETGADPEGASQQLPHRRLHRGAGAARSWSALSPRSANVPLVEDLGSGLLAPLPAPLDGEPTVAESLARRRRRGHVQRRQAAGRAAGRPGGGPQAARSAPCARTRSTARCAWTR